MLRLIKAQYILIIVLTFWIILTDSILIIHGQSILSLEIDRSNFRNVTWAADGNSIVLADNDDIVIFDTNLNLIDRIPVGYLQEVSLSPDGNYAALARWNGDVELWDVTSWTSLATMRSGDTYLKLIEWSPDSALLAVAESSSSTIEVWDVQTSEIVSEHTFPESENIQVAEWSPDSTKLAIGFRSYESNQVVVWDVESQEVTTTFDQHLNDVWNIAWHPNGQWIASRDVPFDCSSGVPVSMIWVWNAEIGEAINSYRTYHCSENPLAWSPDGQYLTYTAETNFGYYASKTTNLHIIELATGEIIAEWKISEEDTVISIEWNSVGDKILYNINLSSSYLTFPDCASPLMGIVDITSSEIVKYHSNQQLGSIYDMTWSGDGGLLATAGTDRHIHIWDIHTGEVAKMLAPYPCNILHIAWNPTSNQIVSSDYLDVYLWDTNTGAVLYTSDFFWSNVIDSQTLIWNAAGSQILAFDFDGRGRVWDSSLNILYDFEIPFPLENFPQAVYWGEDAPMVARGLDPIEIWRVSEQPTLELTLPRNNVNIPTALAWNYDGSLLAVRNENQSIDIWNMDGSLLNTITPDTEVGRTMWHPQANYLIVGNGLSLDVYNIMIDEVITTLSVSGGLLTWNNEGTNVAGVNPDAIRIWTINPLE